MNDTDKLNYLVKWILKQVTDLPKDFTKRDYQDHLANIKREVQRGYKDEVK